MLRGCGAGRESRKFIIGGAKDDAETTIFD